MEPADANRPHGDEQDLPAQVRRDVARIRRLRKAAWLLGWPMATAAVACVSLLLRDSLGRHSLGGLPVVGAAWLLACLAVGAAYACLWRMHTQAARRLARANNVRYVGPLVESLRQLSWWSPWEVTTPLLRLLPRMESDDFRRMTAADRQAVRYVLSLGRLGRWRGVNWGWYPDLQVALLEMLARCGDEGFVQPVRDLAYGAADDRVCAAARECLERLEARAAQERDAARLLRPADAPAGDVLLRPAASTAEAPAEQLLRPAERE